MPEDARSARSIDRRDLLKAQQVPRPALCLLPQTVAAQSAPRRGGTLRVTMPYNPALGRSDDRP